MFPELYDQWIVTDIIELFLTFLIDILYVILYTAVINASLMMISTFHFAYTC